MANGWRKLPTLARIALCSRCAQQPRQHFARRNYGTLLRDTRKHQLNHQKWMQAIALWPVLKLLITGVSTSCNKTLLLLLFTTGLGMLVMNRSTEGSIEDREHPRKSRSFLSVLLLGSNNRYTFQLYSTTYLSSQLSPLSISNVYVNVNSELLARTNTAILQPHL
jgi:hypothetical protein